MCLIWYFHVDRKIVAITVTKAKIFAQVPLFSGLAVYSFTKRLPRVVRDFESSNPRLAKSYTALQMVRTRYTLRRNTASIMKGWFRLKFERS